MRIFDYGSGVYWPLCRLLGMSKQQEITEDTLFRLADVQEAFLKYFGEETKSLATINRYAKGVKVPFSNRTVRLKTRLSSMSRARKTSFRMWKQFYADLEAAYAEAMEVQDG